MTGLISGHGDIPMSVKAMKSGRGGVPDKAASKRGGNGKTTAPPPNHEPVQENPDSLENH